VALTAIAAVGTAIQVYGQIQSANSQSDAAKKDAAAKTAMSDEVQARAVLNRKYLDQQGQEQMGNQISQYAAGNVDVGSGSPLMSLEHTLSETNRKINNGQIEADFRSRMYLLSSTNEYQNADAESNSAWWKASGSILTGGSNIARGFSGGAPSPGASGLGSEGGGGSSTGGMAPMEQA
jgi:hypothetical protein